MLWEYAVSYLKSSSLSSAKMGTFHTLSTPKARVSHQLSRIFTVVALCQQICLADSIWLIRTHHHWTEGSSPALLSDLCSRQESASKLLLSERQASRLGKQIEIWVQAYDSRSGKRLPVLMKEISTDSVSQIGTHTEGTWWEWSMESNCQQSKLAGWSAMVAK